MKKGIKALQKWPEQINVNTKGKMVVLLELSDQNWKEIKKNYDRKNNVYKPIREFSNGQHCRTYQISTCVWGGDKHKAKAITCTATQCFSYYDFLPKYACIIKSLNSSPVKIPYQALCVTRKSSFSQWHRLKATLTCQKQSCVKY